jgi:hypothetical protein
LAGSEKPAREAFVTAYYFAYTRRLAAILAFLLVAVLLACRNAQANELFSESVTVPPLPSFDVGPVAGWHSFSILLSGNPNLPAQDATDTNTDPFAVNGISHITIGGYTPIASDAGTAVGPGLVKLPGLTRVNFTGTTDINLANIPDQQLSNPAGQVQFGLAGPLDNSTLDILAQHWSGNYDTQIAGPTALGYLRGIPVVSVIPHPAPPAAAPSGTSFQYIVDFLQFTQDGVSGSEWVEFPYVPGQQPSFTYGGWADTLDPIRFTNSEIQLSDTRIPLDDLNYADDAPTRLSGINDFQAQVTPDDVVPEPGAGALMFIIGAAVVTRRQGHRSRREAS